MTDDRAPPIEGEVVNEIVEDDEEIARLALLPPVAYDREREHAAKRLGCRVGTLDEAVKRERQKGADADGQGQTFKPIVLAPWPAPVYGVALLDEIADLIDEYVVIDPHGRDAIALWILFAHCLDAAQTAPRLMMRSPQKRCGKTRLLSIILRLTPRALPTSNITASALFRAVDRWAPTLVVDETDTFLKQSPELGGILNSGHTRDLAFVIRTVGDEHEPARFSTWAAIAFASIGEQADTLEDRSIIVPMRRRLKGERIGKLPRPADDTRAGDLACKAARWSADNLNAINRARPQLPPELDDRARDNWETLLAIAERAGGSWPHRAREAARALSEVRDTEDDGSSILLLGDIKAYFEGGDCDDPVASVDLVRYLNGLDERDWPQYGKAQKPLSQNLLARLLKPFGIRPQKAAPGLRGYFKRQFEDAWERYLSPNHAENATTTAQPEETAEIRGSHRASRPPREPGNSAWKNTGDPQDSAENSAWAVAKPDSGSRRGDKGGRKFVYQDHWALKRAAEIRRFNRSSDDS